MLTEIEATYGSKIYRLTMGFHEHYANVMGFHHGKRTFNQQICWYNGDISWDMSS